MTPLCKKLQLKPEMKAKFVNAPAGYLDALGAAAAQAETDLDFVQLFAKDGAELAELWPETHKALKYDDVLWICYPKKSSGMSTDLNRDEGWAPVFGEGLRPVTAVSIDAVWTGLRFRPVEKVKSSR